MVSFSQISDIGGRQYNEDAVLAVKADDENWLFAVADGVGGHGGGKIASQKAVETARNVFLKCYKEENCLQQCFDEAQRIILEVQQTNSAPDSYKTTLTLLQIQKDRYCFGHVGDSRLYLFENRKMVRRTVDHSMANRMAAQGQIREEEIRTNPYRNRLYVVVGSTWDEVRHYELTPWYPGEGELSFLLCTDGFWQYVIEDEMEATLGNGAGCGDWLGAMTQTVRNKATARSDNYTALTVIWDTGKKALV